MSKVNARIVHHRISTDDDFTVAPNTDYEEFNGWTEFDLADGEIGVNLFREKIYANINGVVKQITTGEGTVTIDTTPITGGATGYPLYHKSGNVVGEFTGAYFDTVNNRVGIGTTTPAGSLHVKGVGNLVTDVIAQFNSANGTSGVFKVNGDGSFTIGSSGSNGINGYWVAGLYAVSIANLLYAVPDLNKVDLAGGKRIEFNPGAYISTPGNGTIKISSVSGGALSNGMWLHPYSGSMSFGADHAQDGTHQATFYNGTAPSTAISTAFKMFSSSGQPKFLLGSNDVVTLKKVVGKVSAEVLQDLGLVDTATYVVADTGTTVSFVKPTIYNSPTTPATGNITYTLTGSKIGVVQKLYHNHSTAPTFPAGTVLVTGNYVTSTLNIIELEWVSGTRVEIRITQG